MPGDSASSLNPYPLGETDLEASLVTAKDWSPPRGLPFPIVGIGASAGGLVPFAELLHTLVTDTGMAVVLIQHLDPEHDSLLAEILGTATRMPVITVLDGMRIEPNKVYIIPPNASMILKNDRLKLARREAGLHLPIDIFFRSLASAQGSRAIGVVLSGNASDGSQGLRAIKMECGLTFVQDEATARFSGMPRNAIATGAVDYVMSPADIGRELSQLGHHRYLVPTRSGDAESETLPEGESELKRIFALVATATGVDFSHYKPTTVLRRIGRRMMVLRIESLGEYARHTELNPAELRELYRDLLISVTSFFRDGEAFTSLAKLLTDLFAERAPRRDPIRVWVPGCATGEEVYSLAICLTELLQAMQVTVPLQLFGTDLSEFALEKARNGTYSEIIRESVSPERLGRFFTKVDSGYQIVKAIRESCVFARHDVTKDPPFSRLDLVSCRNLLIYLDTVAQRRVLPIFHYALKPSGLLLLGSAETTAAASDLFTAVDKPHCIYARKPGPVRLSFDVSMDLPAFDSGQAILQLPNSAVSDLQKRVDRLIQSKYSPDAVLVDDELHILQFRGHTSPYLDPSPGAASLNLLRMARESLVMPLRRVIKTATDTERPAKERFMFERDGRFEDISVEVTPIQGEVPGNRFSLIVFSRFESSRSEPGSPQTPAPNGDSSAELQREISDAHEYLRHLTEAHETHSEELRAANEEIRSANEELQSANEELGTTKEELQSANEELTTINDELQNRNTDMSSANSDLRNLLSSVSVAIVMVDADLRVRRFNTVAEKLLALGSIDIGRPIGQLQGHMETPDLEKQVRHVIDTLHTVEVELQDDAGCWYSVIARPYRTVDDRIAGAVVTLQDISPLKRGLKAAEQARDYAEGMIDTVREPLVVLDGDLRVQRATPAFYETFLVSREETQGRFLYDLGNGQWNQPRLRELIGAASFGGKPFQDFEVEHDFPHIGRRTMRLNARRIPRQDTQNVALLLAIEDVTERRQVAEIRFQRLFETAKDGIIEVDAETGIVTDVNPFLLQVTGFPREELVGRKLPQAEPFLGLTQIATLMSDLRAADLVRHDDIPLHTTTGGPISMELVANLYSVGNQPVAQLNFRDITDRKEQDESLRRSVEEKGVLVREVHHRVKNNLQVIVSLLSLQASYTKDAKALAAFEETEGRVRAIAHIHETLYATPDLAQIEFASYLTNLTHELLRLHATIPDGVILNLDVEEMVLDMEQAIPLGLIVNELIVNSLKYGLPQGRGTLSVSLAYTRDSEQPHKGQSLDEGWAELRIADDGPGLPADVNLSAARSMGFRLLNLLVKQLHGRIHLSKGPGAKVCVEFPLITQPASLPDLTLQ